MKVLFKTIFILLIILNNNFIYAEVYRIDSLKNKLEKTDKNEQFDILLQLAKEYKKTSIKKSFYYSKQAIKNSQELGNKENESRALCFLGKTYKYQGKTNDALASFQKALKIEKENDNKPKISEIYKEIGLIYQISKNYEKAIKILIKAQNICPTDTSKAGIYICLFNLYRDKDIKKTKLYKTKLDSITKLINNEKYRAMYYMVSGNYYNVIEGNYKKALKYYKLTEKLHNNLKFKINEAALLNNMGTAYEKISEYDKALKYFIKSLEISKKQFNKTGIAKAYLNIGLIHYRNNNYEKAAYFYKESLKIRKELNDLNGMALIYNNLAIIYYYKKDNKKTKLYFEKAYDIYCKTGNLRKQLMALGNLGELASAIGDNNTALKYYNKCLPIYEKLKDKDGIAYTLLQLAGIENKENNYGISKKYLNRTIKIAKTINSKDYLETAYLLFYELYKDQKKYKKALLYHVKYFNIHDSIYNETSQEKIAEIQTKYETHEKQNEIELLSKDKALKEAEIKKQRYIKNGLIIGSIFILIFAFLTYNRFLIKKRSNELLTYQKNEILEKNEELNQQKEEILAQRDTIEDKNKYLENAYNTIKQKNKNITDSINYAKKIQSALLPPEPYLNNILENYFILYKPKDIVSGDFYWVKKNKNKIIIAVADCTGHGVPGAFMSILGSSFLNEISHINSEIESNKILNILSRILKEALHQKEDKIDTTRDGMDIALYIIDTTNNTLQYSGAYNPLYLVRNKELYKYKADKMPIGLSRKENKSFTKNEIELEKNDSIYIFTDGYIDQFDETDKEKFKTKRFQKLLVDISDLPMSEQKEKLNSTIEKWKGNSEQIDDMLVFGVKI